MGCFGTFSGIGFLVGFIFGGFGGGIIGMIVGGIIDAIAGRTQLKSHYYQSQDFTEHELYLAAYV
ncbi:MAG: hypothetical protein J5799_03420, partial [Bacteroidales bacterium]|nr:hypothetical protein [Bacteroidales bacterium]